MSQLRIYNSLTRSLEPFEPMNPGQVKMYVCGITVYDYCHIGHARAMLSFDMVYRWLMERGYQVDYARNYTDVDDKIIKRAQENGEAPLALSERFIAALNDDLERLGLELPTVQPKVSEHIDDIITLIGQIIENGYGYATEAGDVFFAVEEFPEYGKLSGKRIDQLRAGERVAVDDRKRHPADFALWKSTKSGEEGAVWDSPWGPGRPGWHIECSAMARHHLGETFDIHGGGIDLIFPHHENEIAQSECGTGTAPMARYWMHNGHLKIMTRAEDGSSTQIKMSKSLGNVIRIRDILNQIPAEALRLVYFESHYRSPMPYSSDRLAEATQALDRMYQAKEALEAMAARPKNESAEDLVSSYGEPAADLHRMATTFQDNFSEAMDEDFNSARALSHLWELVRATNRFAGLKKARRRGAALAELALSAFALAGRVLGIGGMTADAWFETIKTLHLRHHGMTEQDILDQIAARDAARREKNYARSDEIREALLARGVNVMDSPTGTTWRVKFE
ncbi:MAG: cysteine--tRNA ligase [Myxococcota bacterium]